MVKLAKMDSTHISLCPWLVAISVSVIAYAGYRYYNKYKTDNVKKKISPHAPKTARGNSLASLKSKCWTTYVELEELRSLKNKCAKIVAGDISIITAVRQLKVILDSGKSADYMASRIIGQVCDFIINMATANRMIDDSGEIIMPKAHANLPDKSSFFANIQTAPEAQAMKYEAVINYQTKELQSERDDMRFVKSLQDLLPHLQVVSYLSRNEDRLSSEEIVEKAEILIKEITPMLEQYGY